MTIQNNTETGRRLPQLRVNHRLFPVIIGAFLALGLVVMFGVRANAYGKLGEAHNVILSNLARQLQDEIDFVTSGISLLASGEEVRVFALASNNTAYGGQINSRNDLLARFLLLIRREPNVYAAVRYIDGDGILRDEVVSRQSSVSASNLPDPISMADDPLFAAALTAPPGSLYMGPLRLQTEVNGQPLPEPRAIFRFATPVRFRESAPEALGVLQVDVFANDILQAVSRARLQAAYSYEGRRFLLENNQGQHMADSQVTDITRLFDMGTTADGAEGSLMSNRLGEISAFLNANPGTLTVADSGGHMYSAMPVTLNISASDQPWRLVVMDDPTIIFANDYTASAIIFVVSLVVGVAVALVVNQLLQGALWPMEQARVLAQQAVRNDANQPVTLPAGVVAADDLANSITHMSGRLHEMNKSMENQRKRLTRNIEIAARISRETAMLQDIHALLNRVVDLICDEYGFYHAQVFRMDDVGLHAVLAYSHGEAGEKLLQERHKIPVGSPSVIGTVTATKKPLIVNDTQAQSYQHAFNPVLPYTRSEMALPLQVGGELLGALDIQSVNPNVFQEEELQAFSLLADQVAIAVYNAQLLVREQERARQVDNLNRQLTREAWEEAEEKLKLDMAYRYDLVNTTQDEADTPAPEHEAVTMPITIRGEVIGAMDIALPEGESFSEGDQMILRAVTERVALAIENARLFQETQLTLSETSQLYELSRNIHEAETLEGVIQAIIHTVMPDASAGQILEFEDYVHSSPMWMRVTADWSTQSRDWQHATLVGLRLRVPDYRLLSELSADQVFTSSDLDLDDRVDDELKIIYGSLNARALVVVPLNMRGAWRATLMVEFSQPRRFDDQELRLFRALTDQAGAAVDNRLLFQQTEATLELRERMYAASRTINTAETVLDLVAALQNTLNDPSLSLAMSLLEGDTDVYGWPKFERVVARTENHGVREVNEVYELNLRFESPLHAREPEIVRDENPDAPAPSALVQRMRLRGQRTEIIYPLFNDNQPVALFYVSHPDLYELSAEDNEFYVALTGQMSTVLQKRRLLEQTERALEETRRLYAASRAITSAQELALVYEIAAEHLAQAAPGLSRIAVLLAEPEDDPAAPYLNYVLAWTRTGRDTRAGIRVGRNSVPYVRLIETEGGLVYKEVARDLADDEHFALLNEEGVAGLIAAPLQFRQRWFGVLVCESFHPRAFEERFPRFVQTIADQVAIAIENRRLFESAEGERRLLSSILETMPSGVMLLDAETLIPVQVNDQVGSLLGREVDMNLPFTAELYSLYRTGTLMSYPDDDLPIYTAARMDVDYAPSDDIVVMRDDGYQADLLMNAAPIRDSRGEVSGIVAVLEDISSLRGLENALQDNLRETIALYEASRTLNEADEIDDVVEVLVTQLYGIEPGDVAVILLDIDTGLTRVARTMFSPPEEMALPPSILETSGPVFINDVTTDRGLDDQTRAELESIGVLSLAVLPLRSRSRELPTGWVVITYAEPHVFTPEDERFLTTLSDSAATVLDNRYLFISTQEALQEVSILYQASRSLTDASGYKDILDAAVNHLVQENEFSSVFMVLLAGRSWDHPQATADVVVGWTQNDEHINLEGITLDAQQFPAWPLLSSTQLVAIEDVYTAQNLDEMQRIGISSMDMRSVVIMPLRVSNRVIGAIWMGSLQPQRFTSRDLRIYRSFAEQTSITMEASRLLEQTERRARQLATSAEVGQIFSSILELDALLPRIVDLIRDSFGYDHVQVFLMDREDEYALLRASTGEAGRQLLSVGHKLAKGSRSLIGEVTARGEPVIAMDTGGADVVHKPNPYLPNTRSEMALPVIIKGKVVGALDVQSNQPNAFDDEDVAVLTTLAAQLSVAIDNARLFQQAERRASDMSLLFAVTTAAASAETLDQALQNVADDLIDSLGALSVGIYLPVVYLDEISDETYIMLRAAAAAGIEQPLSELSEIRVGDDSHTIGTSAANFRSTIINRVSDDPLYLPLNGAARSAVIVPLASGAQLIGVLALEHVETFAYNHETLTLLQTMGGSLSAIIQNAQLLEQVQNTNEQLRELDRIKSEFLANMSHELRTPLNSIIGFSRVILKGIDGPLTEMQEQDLTTIYNSGQHLLNLINDILDQAKIAAGKMELKPDYFDIKSVVEGVRSIGMGLVKEKRITMKIEMESGLPQVYGDEIRTRQVLINLVSNAAKFTHEGSITLSVYRYQAAETGRDMVRVDITDTGIGIAEKDMPLLFEAFRQVDSSLTRTAGGTGLGLPISKALVEMQGGEMLVTSQMNAGSTFSITIPLEPMTVYEVDPLKPATGPLDTVQVPSVEEIENLPTNGHTPQEEVNLDDTLRLSKAAVKKAAQSARTKNGHAVLPPKRQILLIEDNPDRVDQYRRAIQREGFDVFTATFPMEAEAMASGLRPTLIIMDVNFAEGAGWNILAKLKDRDDTFDIPLIVVSLSSESERAYQMGAYTFLQHPILPEQLVEAVLEAERESNTERILIIDDQPEAARLLTQLLDEHGQYRVFAAHNGVEGVSMVARRRPDLVILDLRMPEMDGFAVLQELRSNPETANIPVLVVTGDTLNAAEQDLLVDVGLLYKTDISLDEYQRFIEDVQTQLAARNGDE